MFTDDDNKKIQMQIKPLVAEGISTWLKGVTIDDPANVAETHLSSVHVLDKIRTIERYLSNYISKDKRILEIGVGFGAFSAYTRKILSWNVFGFEPDVMALNIAMKLSKTIGNESYPAVRALGEAIPYPNECFDFVYSSNVLEHVVNPSAVLRESLRVLKPEGYLFFTFPNYGSWWEGHYGILWLPNMPKWLAKCYVALFGRNALYIDTLQFTTVSLVKKLLKPHLQQIKVLTYGKDVWIERMRSLDFYEGGSSSK